MKIQKISAQATSESGLTLIEMLMAVSILVIIGGSAYFAFKTAVDAYQKTEEKVLAAQRCRFAMDRLVTDLGNMQVSPQEPELALYTQDGPSQLGDRDMLSFVTLVRTDPDPFLEQLSSFQSQNALQVPSPLLKGGAVPETDENGEPIYVDVATLITGLANFDLQYFDGEAEVWNDSWDDPESIPSAVQILITVQGEAQRTVRTDTTQFASQNQPVLQPNSMTQSTMVYLPASATAGEGAQGAP